ncbi:Uncharacterized protein AB751O23_AW_00010 [Chlamydiales bacterium SCGC AB-751-O23]|nr:Uncharacterized protein AB751O23_AW_00010 [Chlamydiales bacterium SCGC AB-751-O23]
MGCADVIPGVSGGTIAFILGIYSDLLSGIQAFNLDFFQLLLKGKIKKAFSLIPWGFLLPLFLGILCAISLLAKLVHFFLNDPFLSLILFSLFTGLIVASCYCLLKEVKVFDKVFLCFCTLGILCGFGFSSIKPYENSESYYQMPMESYTEKNNWDGFSLKNYQEPNQMLVNLSKKEVSHLLVKYPELKDAEVVDMRNSLVLNSASFTSKENLKEYSFLFLFACGFLGSAAMLAPGISGSYLMLIIGVYPFLIASYVSFLEGVFAFHLDLGILFSLLSFLLGVLVGFACFSRTLSYVLKHYYKVTFSLISGFIIGALRALWPFWEYSYRIDPLHLEKGPVLQKMGLKLLPKSFGDALTFTLLFSLAFFAVISLEKIKKKNS